MNRYLNNKILLSPFILVYLITFWGAAVYRLYALNTLGIIVVACLVLACFFIYLLFYKNKDSNFFFLNREETHSSSTKTPLFLYILYLTGVTASFYVAYSSQTSSALISPWQAIPSYFFLLYFLSTLLLLAITWLRCRLSLALIVIHYFLSFSLALWVYGLGYGFDPFIHQATMELIAQKGAVNPKPFYYLGQYSLVIFLHKITTISIFWINKVLVPLTGALFLPFALFLFLQKWFEDTKINLLLTLIALIFPFSFLIMTTPQNLSYIFLILTLIFGLSLSGRGGMMIACLSALATLSLHPITGVPAVLFIALLMIHKSGLGRTIKKYSYILVFILISTSLPFSFYILNTLQVDKDISWQWRSPLPSPKNLVPGEEGFLLNFIYMYDRLLIIVISLLIIAGIVIAVKNRDKCRILITCFLAGLGLIVSYVITKQFSFNFVIEYEKNGYADRILIVAALFLFLFALIALYAFLKRLLEHKNSIRIPMLLFLIALTPASLYLSYPRMDNYHDSHGYSVSEQTIKAVNWIENDTRQDYIVLADQQVSVSALLEFGFDRYYKNDIYFYPVPTSGKLYDHYLDMVYEKPSRTTMRKATQLAGVDTGYFVLNEYWWAFSKILREARLEADKTYKLGDGEIYIFKYHF